MRLRLIAAALALAAAAPPAAGAAHEKFKIVGTIAKVHEAQIDVKAVDGATYEIDMDETTPVTRRTKKVPHSELEPGRRVVVLALGHDMFDLEAFEIQLEN